MPDYELHADYDHNGRISLTTAEYADRRNPPGAVVVPNLDADERRLPTSVSPGADITPDWERPLKSARDNDLTSAIVRVTNAALVGTATCIIRLTGQRVDQVRLYDQRRRELTRRGNPPAAAFFKDYELSVSSAQIRLRVEAHTIAGSPLRSRRFGYLPRQDPLRVHENMFKLEIITIPVGGGTFIEDWGYFTISPLLFTDNTAPAERVYIAELPENGSTVADMNEILRSISGVRLVRVPLTASLRDAWLQDQFQVGYCHGPSNWMHVVLHLPRLRSNIVQSELVENLATMVTSHFPSRGLGVFQEFWRRAIPITDASGAAHQLVFKDSYGVLMNMARVYRMRKFLLREINARASSGNTTPQHSDWSEFFTARRELPTLLQQLIQLLNRQINDAESDSQASLLRQIKRAYRTRVQEIINDLSLTNNNVRVPLTSSVSVELNQQAANRLFSKLQQMHDSVNYGGNLEVSPPVSNYPLGKIVVGNVQFGDATELMDPTLLRFLRTQAKQPLVELDTTWLEVSHVDEIVTFVKDQNTRRPAILRASPGIALRILAEAYQQYQNGLPIDHPQTGDYRPSGVLSRHLDEGTSPVTHMLRGKQWLHHHPRNALMELEPPWIYRQMAECNSRWMVSIHEIPYHPGEGEDRRYFSTISIPEFLYFEADRSDTSVNGFIETQFMAELERDLQSHFSGVPIIQLPVLFDGIANLDNWRDGKRRETTAAFTPNVVNMQIVNNTLIIPRPYGPRMKAADAISVLERVFRGSSQSSRFRGINSRYFQRKHLDKTYYWVKSAERVYIMGRPIRTTSSPYTGPHRPIIDSFGEMTNVSHVARQFKDGFPGLSMDEIEERIYRANRAHFTRRHALHSRWRKLIIPENTVDLFEAYTQIVVESLGLRVRWIDSWFYHVRLGEIHCGTNVIRRPDTGNRNAWWRVNPATQYQSEGETVQESPA